MQKASKHKQLQLEIFPDNELAPNIHALPTLTEWPWVQFLMEQITELPYGWSLGSRLPSAIASKKRIYTTCYRHNVHFKIKI